MKKLIKIEDLFPFHDFYDSYYGLFMEYFTDAENYPLVSPIFRENYGVLYDVEYFGTHSAEKYVIPMLVKVIDLFLENHHITLEDLKTDGESRIDLFNAIFSSSSGCGFADMIYNRFGVKWKKLFDVLMTEYKPLENYSMLEERTPDLTETENGTIKKDVSSESDVYGFNSVDSTPSGETSGDETEVKQNLTTKHTGKETLTRSGNIGVTTSQQMLESEFEVRKKDLLNLIYNDIDSVLCLKCY